MKMHDFKFGEKFTSLDYPGAVYIAIQVHSDNVYAMSDLGIITYFYQAEGMSDHTDNCTSLEIAESVVDMQTTLDSNILSRLSDNFNADDIIKLRANGLV